MKRDDSVYIRHILDAINWVEQYVGSMTYEKFLDNHLIQDGVTRQVEIIGEASSKLSKGFRNKHSNIPWKDVIGMRNKLIHDYFGVDLDAVWETSIKDLPILKKELQIISDD